MHLAQVNIGRMAGPAKAAPGFEMVNMSVRESIESLGGTLLTGTYKAAQPHPASQEHHAHA